MDRPRTFARKLPVTDNPGRLAVEEALEELGERPSVIYEELEGGASTRQFFRTRFDKKSVVAMFTPAPSQEIAKAKQSSGYASFVEVAELLHKNGISAPQIYAASTVSPVLLVEDLGDATLATYLERHPQRKEYLYQLAVSLLSHAQRRLNPLPSDCVIRTRAFDHELLLWEVEHFHKWALEARGIQLKSGDERVFSEAAEYLARTISDWPREFVHRDYQSRNLMVRGPFEQETLTWIDFQDAMLGPRVYDLVALLTDSYQTFSPDFIERRLDEYCQLRGCEAERDQIGLEFSLVTVQRKLKDAGRFVFLDRVNNNHNFLKFVEPTIEKARRALLDVHHLGPLSELENLLDRIFEPLV